MRTQVSLGHTGRFKAGTLESSLMRTSNETEGRTIPTASRPAADPSIGTDRTLETVNTVLDTKFVAPIGYSNRITVGGQYWDAELVDGLLRSEEHTSELQSRPHLVCRLL